MPIDQERLCLVAPPLAYTTLPVPLTRASPNGCYVVTVPEGLSLGSCGLLRAVSSLTWVNDRGMDSEGSALFTVVSRCSPLDLVRLWCRVNGPWLRSATFACLAVSGRFRCV